MFSWRVNVEGYPEDEFFYDLKEYGAFKVD